MLEEAHVPCGEDLDHRVDIAARIDGAIARHHQAGPHMIGDRRRQLAQLVAVDHSIGDPCAELDHRLQRREVVFGLGDIVVGDQQFAAQRDGDALRGQAFEDRPAVAIELGQRRTAGLIARCRAVAGERHQPGCHLRDRLGKHAQCPRRVAQRLQRVADRAGRGQRLDDGSAHEAGVAACRATAERAVVDDGHLGAGLREEQRRRQADQPATDDDDVLAHEASRIPAAAAARWAIARSCTARPTLLKRVISESSLAVKSTGCQIGEIAGDPVPAPRALFDGEVEIAGFRLRGRDVVYGDGGCGDEVGCHLAQVETVRADEVDVCAWPHVVSAEQRLVRPCRRADDVACRGVGIGSGDRRLTGGDELVDDAARHAPLCGRRPRRGRCRGAPRASRAHVQPPGGRCR